MTPAEQDPAHEDRNWGRPAEQAELVVVTLAELRPTYPVSELLGRAVINDDGERIGPIVDLLIEGDRLAFAVLSVGGFLGIGAHEVVAPFDALLIDDDEVVLPGASREALRRMTAHDRDQARRERAPLRKAQPGARAGDETATNAAGEPLPGVVAHVATGAFR